MGGGTSIWASPEWKSDPKEIFNWKLWYLTTTVAFAGCAYGFDQGNIGGVLTLPSFKKAFGLDVLSETEADERGMCWQGLQDMRLNLRALIQSVCKC